MINSHECTQEHTVSRLVKAVYGNGDASKSIISRLTAVEVQNKVLFVILTPVLAAAIKILFAG